MAARSKAWFCCRSLAGVAGSNPSGGMSVPVGSIVCYQVDVSATGLSLVQRRRTECGMSECDRRKSTVRRPRPARGCCAIKNCIHMISLARKCASK